MRTRVEDREIATKVLGELTDRGLVRRGRGRIALLDIDGLPPKPVTDAGVFTYFVRRHLARSAYC